MTKTVKTLQNFSVLIVFLNGWSYTETGAGPCAFDPGSMMEPIESNRLDTRQYLTNKQFTQGRAEKLQ